MLVLPSLLNIAAVLKDSLLPDKLTVEDNTGVTTECPKNPSTHCKLLLPIDMVPMLEAGSRLVFMDVVLKLLRATLAYVPVSDGMSADTRVLNVGAAALPEAGPENTMLALWLAKESVRVPEVVIGLPDTVKMLDGAARATLVTDPPPDEAIVSVLPLGVIVMLLPAESVIAPVRLLMLDTPEELPEEKGS